MRKNSEQIKTDRDRPLGFTIVETMIVLAIGTVVGISALILLTERLSKNDFMIASNNFVQHLQQVLTDTDSGYYFNNGNFTCNEPASPGSTITISSGSTAQGSNYGCISLGTVLQLHPLGQSSQYVIIPLAGNQYTDALNTEVSETIPQAQPIPIATYYGSPSTVDASQTANLDDGLQIYYLKADSNDGTHVNVPVGAIGFLPGDASGNLASQDSTSISSNAQTLQLYYVGGTNVNEARPTLASQINATNLIAAKDVQICITNGGDESDLVTMNGTNASDITSKTEADGTC
jgi:type II secretory pathway pseudopilin PulG